MTRKQQTENKQELIEKFKEQVQDENFILRLEQMQEQNLYEVFETFERYDQIYR